MLNDIEKVIEYRAPNKAPWGNIKYWQMKIEGNDFWVSSIVISKLNFDRFFWNKIKEEKFVWPRMPNF